MNNTTNAVSSFKLATKLAMYAFVPGFMLGMICAASSNEAQQNSGLFFVITLGCGVFAACVLGITPFVIGMWYLFLSMLGQVSETIATGKEKPRRSYRKTYNRK